MQRSLEIALAHLRRFQPREIAAARNRRFPILRCLMTSVAERSHRLRGNLDGLYPIGYNAPVIEIRQTDVYAAWFDKLRDRQARARILTSKLRWNWREHFRSRHEQNSNEIVGCGRASEER